MGPAASLVDCYLVILWACFVFTYLLSRYMWPGGPWQRLRSNGGGLLQNASILSQTDITGHSSRAPFLPEIP